MSSISSSPPLILQDVLEANARGIESDLQSCIGRSQAEIILGETKTSCHLYQVKLDGNNRPMVLDLIRLAAQSVVDYAIPRTRLAEAYKNYEATGSATALQRLSDEAKSLFTDVPLTGEGGELLLFLLAEKVLRLPQLFSKMSLKTSTRHHFNGTDALHAGVTENGKLALYWGEAKMYTNWKSAIKSAVEGLSVYLRNDGGKCDRDVQLLSEHVDLTNPGLEEAICSYLLPSSPHFKQAEYRGLVFVGYDVDSYDVDVDSLTPEIVTGRLVEAYGDWERHLSDQLVAEQVQSIVLHVFLLPFPKVSDFRAEFLKALGLANGN